MNFIDIMVLLFLISAVVRGVEFGLVRQVCYTIGVLSGVLVGAWVQGKLIHLVHTPPSKALLVLVTIVTAVAIFSSIGDYIGRQLKSHLQSFKVRGVDVGDRVLGSLLAGATLLVSVWLGASIFTNTPAVWLQRQIHNSVIVAGLNKTLPPTPDIVARLGHLIDPNGFPNVFTGLEPHIDTDKPLPSIGELDGAVRQSRAAVVKIEGTGCGGVSQGSGFVAATGLVITNAHVVAGVEQPYILDGAGRHAAQVMWFDSGLDMAVLRASGLAGKPLDILPDVVPNGTTAAVLGYPGGGDFTARPAMIVDSFIAIGTDIYNQKDTEREVYSMKADVVPGNSGGPVIDQNGHVIGLVFAESTTYDDVGYSLTTNQVLDGLNRAKTRSRPTLNGSCTQ